MAVVGVLVCLMLAGLVFMIGVLGYQLATGHDRIAPTCAEMGGHQVVAGYHPLTVGKVTTLMPFYRCEVPAR